PGSAHGLRQGRGRVVRRRDQAGPRALRARWRQRRDGARSLPARVVEAAGFVQGPQARGGVSGTGDAMKAKDLKERSSKDLSELKKTLEKDLFNHRMKNFTNQLDNTSLLRKTRRDVARIAGIL